MPRLLGSVTSSIAALLLVNTLARADGWQPTPGHEQIPIWPAAIPDAVVDPNPESVDPGGGVTHVSRPTMTVYAAHGADELSCRPDFAVAIYPGHLWVHEDDDRATRVETDLRLRPDITVRADSPPTFLLQAEDDDVEQTLAYYVALQKARVPAEMHLYARGGHAFGLQSKLPIGQWPRLAETWLKTIGMVDAAVSER